MEGLSGTWKNEAKGDTGKEKESSRDQKQQATIADVCL
jgi:hypothetical protein